MRFISQRLFHTNGIKEGDYTCAHVTNREGYDSFNLEDTYHPTKIAGVTRVPAGFYELVINDVLTPLTKKHREDYKESPWFKANPDWFHIMLKDVPNYTGVYVHTGNDDLHTLACQLLNFGFDIAKKDKQGFNSMLAVDKFYSIVYPLLKTGKKVFFEIRDEITQ